MSPPRPGGGSHTPRGAAHLLNVVVQAADGEAGVVVIPPNALWVLLGETRPGLSQRR